MSTGFRLIPRLTPGTNLLSWTVIISIIISIVIIPGIVYWLGALGGLSSIGISTLTFGLIAMGPGVLMGIAALLVMVGSR